MLLKASGLPVTPTLVGLPSVNARCCKWQVEQDTVLGPEEGFAHAEAEYRGWLRRLLTHPIEGLESYAEMMRQLTEEKQAGKV